MRRFLLGMAGLAAIIMAGADSASAQYTRWNPYLEVEGRAGDGRERGQGRVFLPLYQDSSSLLFGDIRLMYNDRDAIEGNIGLGYRQILSNRRILGAYGFFDVKDSELDNRFYQGSFGMELLDINWGLRANGYIPNTSPKLAPGANAFLQGNQIFVQGNQERAYYGADVEAEHILFRSNRGRGFVGAGDFEVWAAGGYFYFDNSADYFHEIEGPRARVEARLYDLPMLGNDSRLVASYQYEYDDVRGSVNQGFLNVRIPFGKGACLGCKRPKMNLLDRRMVTPIVRDIDIVSNVAQGGFIDEAKNLQTGTVLNDVVVLTSADDLLAEIEGGPDNRVFILDGSDGPELLTETLDLNDGQILIGGGGEMTVVGCTLGLEAVFNTPGEQFTIDQTNGGVAAIGMADNSGVYGLTIQGGLFSASGTNIEGFEIAGNNLMGAGLNAIGILPAGGTLSEGNVFDNMISGTGGDAIGILTIGDAVVDLNVAGNTFDMIGGNGLGITATFGDADITAVVDNNTFNDVAGDAVDINVPVFPASPTLDVSVTNNRIIGNGSTVNGVDVFTANDTDLTLVVDNNIIDGVTEDAVQLDSDTVFVFFGSNAAHDVTITNNMILGRGVTSDGVDIFLNGTSSIVANISDNVFDDVNDDGIEFETDGNSVGNMLTIERNMFLGRGNSTDGVDLFVDSNSQMDIVVNNNLFDQISSDAFELDVNDDGVATLMFTNNRILGAGVTTDGVDIDMNDDADLTATLQGNMFMNVVENNIDIAFVANDDALIDVDILDNTITGGLFGLNIDANPIDNDSFLTVGGNTITTTTPNAGIFIDSTVGDLILDSNGQNNEVNVDGGGMIFNINGSGGVNGNIMINGVDEVFP